MLDINIYCYENHLLSYIDILVTYFIKIFPLALIVGGYFHNLKVPLKKSEYLAFTYTSKCLEAAYLIIAKKPIKFGNILHPQNSLITYRFKKKKEKRVPINERYHHKHSCKNKIKSQ